MLTAISEINPDVEKPTECFSASVKVVNISKSCNQLYFYFVSCQNNIF